VLDLQYFMLAAPQRWHPGAETCRDDTYHELGFTIRNLLYFLCVFVAQSTENSSCTSYTYADSQSSYYKSRKHPILII